MYHCSFSRTTFLLFALYYSTNLHAHPIAFSKNIFRRLIDGVQTTRCSRCLADSSLLRNRHRCLYADGRLYFLSLKGKRQPTFSSYHDTALYGGYLSTYGLGENETDPITNDAALLGASTNSWSWSHTHFDALDKNENREDAFFTLNNRLFLLIYTRFENVTFRQLYVWQRSTPSAWIDVPLDVDTRSQFYDGNIQNGAVAWTIRDDLENETDDRTRTLYLTATDGWGRIVISKLDVDFDDSTRSSSINQQKPLKAAIRFILAENSTPIDSGGAIVALTYRANKLYAFYGTQGCGFHWEKRRLIIIDLNSTANSIDFRNLTNSLEDDDHFDSPPWAFNGPALIERYRSDWIMFGGSIAAGTTGTEFDGRVWIFNLDTFRWRRSKRTKVPDQLNPYDLCSALDTSNGHVYLADFRHVYKAYLEQICL